MAAAHTLASQSMLLHLLLLRRSCFCSCSNCSNTFGFAELPQLFLALDAVVCDLQRFDCTDKLLLLLVVLVVVVFGSDPLVRTVALPALLAHHTTATTICQTTNKWLRTSK